MLNLYVFAGIVTALTLFKASRRLGDGTCSAPLRASLSVVGGALWPVVLAGVVQFVAIELVVKVFEHPREELFDTRIGIPV